MEFLLDEIINQVTSDFLNVTDDNCEFNLVKFENILLSSDFDGFCDFVKILVEKTLDLEAIHMKDIFLLYFEEMREARRVNGKPLIIKEIVDVLRRQTDVYRVTIATLLQDNGFLLETLTFNSDLVEVTFVIHIFVSIVLHILKLPGS